MSAQLETTLKKIGDTFHDLRIDRGLSKRQLADNLNIKTELIEEIEAKGKIRLNTFIALCEFFFISPKQVFRKRDG